MAKPALRGANGNFIRRALTAKVDIFRLKQNANIKSLRRSYDNRIVREKTCGVKDERLLNIPLSKNLRQESLEMDISSTRDNMINMY